MKRLFISVVSMVMLALPTLAHAKLVMPSFPTKNDPWIVRGQIGAFIPNSTNDLYINGVYAGETESAVEGDWENAVAAEIDVTRFIFDHLAVEASLGLVNGMRTPRLDQSGTRQIADGARLYLVPSTLNLQLHLAPYGKITPYVGAGFAYVFAYQSGHMTHSTGTNIQFGADIWLREHMAVNLEFKKFYDDITADVRPYTVLGDTYAQTTKYDPWVVMLGFSHRF